MIKYKDLINSIDVEKLAQPLTREQFSEMIGVDIKKQWKNDANWKTIDDDLRTVTISIPTHYEDEGVEVVLTLVVNKNDQVTHIQKIVEY